MNWCKKEQEAKITAKKYCGYLRERMEDAILLGGISTKKKEYNMTCRRKKTLKKHQEAYIPYFFIVLYSNVLLLQSSVWVFHILLESLKNTFT